MKRFAIAGLVIAACSMLVAGCNKGGGDSKGGTTKKREVHKAPAGAQLKLAFVTNNASEFWKIASAGVKKYEKEAGLQVDVKLPPNGTVEEQNQILENLVSQGYHGIAVSAIAPKDQVAEINRAAQDQPDHARLRCAGQQPAGVHRHEQLRGRQGAWQGDRQASASRRKDGLLCGQHRRR